MLSLQLIYSHFMLFMFISNDRRYQTLLNLLLQQLNRIDRLVREWCDGKNEVFLGIDSG